MKKLLLHLAKWSSMRAYWVFPGIYLMLSLLCMAFGQTHFNVYGLLCSAVLGIMCHYATKSWLKKEFDDKKIDLDRSNNYDSEKSFVCLWRDMPWWERLLWIPILGFLCIAWWVMVKGLGVLFVGGVSAFVYAFSTVVALTLLWLIVMITRKKHIVGFVLLYLVFDGMSAFSFNFVEFYDNVSSTQRMDRDMKDCRRFSDIQGKYISLVKDRVDELHENSTAKVVSLKKDKANVEKDAQQLRSNARNSFFWEDMKRQNKAASEKETQALKYQSSIDDASALVAHANGLKVRVDSMWVYKEKLDSLTALYRNDKQHFTVKDWQTCKDLAQQIGATLINLSSDAQLKGKVQLDSTEVADIMRHLKCEDQDRFASLNKLFKAINALFLQDNQTTQSSDLLAMNDSAIVRATPVVKPAASHAAPLDEDQQFENRLLYMSIMLSVLIDLLPLALGIFVAYCRPQD